MIDISVKELYYDISDKRLENNSQLKLYNILRDIKEDRYYLNIYRNVELNSILIKDVSYYNTYIIDKEEERWENISYNIYGTERLWWILPLVNEIVNPFEGIEIGEIKYLKKEYIYINERYRENRDKIMERQGQGINVSIVMESGSYIIDSRYIKKLYFIEDIFSYYISGKILFIDSIGILERGPLTGNEVIIIEYGERKEIVFNIYKVGNISSMSDIECDVLIEIDFVDLSYNLLKERIYSKSWKGERISDIVRYMLKEYCKIEEYGEYEDSKNVIDYISPYWNVMDNIKYLSRRGIGSKSGVSGYVYYNNSRGKILSNYCSLDYLFSSENKVNKDVYVFNSENKYYKNLILEWSIKGIDKTGLKGLRGGQRLGYNILGKELLKREYKYSDIVGEINILGKKSLYGEIDESKNNIKIDGGKTKEEIDSKYKSDWIRRYNNQLELNVIMNGNEERYCGQSVELVWPSKSGEIGSLNKQLKGKYVIKRIVHNFVIGNPYVQRVILIKNGYEDIDMKGLVLSKRRNLL